MGWVEGGWVRGGFKKKGKRKKRRGPAAAVAHGGRGWAALRDDARARACVTACGPSVQACWAGAGAAREGQGIGACHSTPHPHPPPPVCPACRLHRLPRLPRPQGMTGAIQKAELLVAQDPSAFMLQQFDNPANPEVHYK